MLHVLGQLTTRKATVDNLDVKATGETNLKTVFPSSQTSKVSPEYPQVDTPST